MYTLLPLLLVACDTLSIYDYELAGSSEVTVPGTPTSVAMAGPLDTLDAGSAAEQIAPGDLADAYFDRITVQSTTPEADLAFLDVLVVSVTAPDLDTVVVARSEKPFQHAGPYTLELLDVDLAPYLETGEATFPAVGEGVTPELDTEVAIAWAITLGITAQGVGHAAEASE